MTFDFSHKMAAAALPCVSGEYWSLVAAERTDWNWATETDWNEVRLQVRNLMEIELQSSRPALVAPMKSGQVSPLMSNSSRLRAW